MSQLIHDSLFGRVLRHLSHGRLFPFEEDRNPALLKHFTVETSSTGDKPSIHSSDEEKAEKGRDENVVDWYGPDDPEVSSSLLVLRADNNTLLSSQ